MSWISAFSLSFAENFFEGMEERLSLEAAVEGAMAGLECLWAGFSGLTNEVPAWLDGAGEEGLRVLCFFRGSGLEEPIIDIFRSLASLAEKEPF